jgi:hypothetical protein
MSRLKDENIKQILKTLKDFHRALSEEHLSDEVKEKKKQAVKAVKQLVKLLGGEKGEKTCTQQKPLLFSEIEGGYEGD